MEFILLWGFCAVVSACIASGKNRSIAGWFVLGLIFGIFAVIAVGFMSKLEPAKLPATARTCPYCKEIIHVDDKKCRHCGKNPADAATPAEQETKLCPFCAETIKKAAIVCKHCGRDLPKEEAPAAE